jgi:translation initiation factor 1A
VSLTTYAACDSTAISAADSACATTSELHVSLNHLTIWTALTFAHQGGKNRRRGKNENDNEKRELTFKEEGQEYAQVLKMLGNGRLEALCFDGEKRLAHIRGKLRKKVWINQGDIILLSLRDYQDEKGDVILKYSADEARSLKAYGELPESAKINETDTYGFFLQYRVGVHADNAADMATRAWMTMSSSTKTEIQVMTRRLILMTSERAVGGGLSQAWVQEEGLENTGRLWGGRRQRTCAYCYSPQALQC